MLKDMQTDIVDRVNLIYKVVMAGAVHNYLKQENRRK
jgi:hypothetical protein